MLPTAAAAWAARGEGGSPAGVMRSHLPLRTSMRWTSFVAPARRMPAGSRAAVTPNRGMQDSEVNTARQLLKQLPQHCREPPAGSGTYRAGLLTLTRHWGKEHLGGCRAPCTCVDLREAWLQQ